MQLPAEVKNFLERQEFVIVSTINPKDTIHCAAKGIVGIEKIGKVYLIDLYKAQTYNNLQKSPTITITAVDEHFFIGYSLQGKAKIVAREKIKRHIINEWEERVIHRISKRLIRNVKGNKQSFHHPEAQFPHPQYLIEMDVASIVDLTPHHLRIKNK